MTSRIDHQDLPDGDEPGGQLLDQRDRELDTLCENWVTWCRERRLDRPTAIEAAAIAKVGAGTRPLREKPECAISAASMAALHIAYTCQPNSLEKQVFDLYYVVRVKPVKTAAAALGIGRAHFYRVLVEFRRRLNLSAQSFARNGAHVAALVPSVDPSEGRASHVEATAVNTESVSQTGDNLGHQ